MGASAARPAQHHRPAGSLVPANYDCGACGYATCAEFLHHTKTARTESADLEFAGPACNLRDVDLGIAVGSAAKTVAIHSINCRCQTRVAAAARKLSPIQAHHAVALSLSMTHKALALTAPCQKSTSMRSTCGARAPSPSVSPVQLVTVTREAARHPSHPIRPTQR
jgi:hypothetical protein